MAEFCVEKICTQCGKTIRFGYYDLEQYVYKRGTPRTSHTKYFCGYKCLREFDKARTKACRKESGAGKEEK